MIFIFRKRFSHFGSQNVAIFSDILQSPYRGRVVRDSKSVPTINGCGAGVLQQVTRVLDEEVSNWGDDPSEAEDLDKSKPLSITTCKNVPRGTLHVNPQLLTTPKCGMFHVEHLKLDHPCLPQTTLEQCSTWNIACQSLHRSPHPKRGNVPRGTSQVKSFKCFTSNDENKMAYPTDLIVYM